MHNRYFLFLPLPRPPKSTLFPYTTLFRSLTSQATTLTSAPSAANSAATPETPRRLARTRCRTDRKSTRLNSSHVSISYAVFCLKKKIDRIDLYAVLLHLRHVGERHRVLDP